jgi:hypothetical protein
MQMERSDVNIIVISVVDASVQVSWGKLSSLIGQNPSINVILLPVCEWIIAVAHDENFQLL